MKQHRPPQPKKPAASSVRKVRAVRLNSAHWLRLRALVLADEPLCRSCAARGLVVPALDVDHIDNDGDNNSRDNLQPLCRSCHSHKTATTDRGRVKYGFDVTGRPLDPDHHWNRNHQQPTATERRGEPHTQRREIQEAGKWQA